MLALVPVAAMGCKVFDQPKRVDGLESRVDELADAVTKLVGEPVGQRPKPKKAKPGHDGEGEGEGEHSADKGASKSNRRQARARARKGGDTPKQRDAHDEAAARRSDDEEAGADDHEDKPAPRDDHDDHDEDDDAPPAAKPHGDVHWSYAGAQGPKRWGELDDAFATCATGREQSPIDLPARRRGETEESVFFVYRPTGGKVVDNGHTLQVDLEPGSYAVVDGARYDLVQFHVHTPSEHQVDGEAYAMEVHLVHKNKSGRLAVVGVLFEAGAASPAMAAVWKQAPKKPGVAPLKKKFDPATLLPDDTAADRYAGSLTTPPCSEGVRWIVLRRPRTDAEAKIAAFRARFGANARPTQPLGERTVE
jgi:carbonic anhydrase